MSIIQMHSDRIGNRHCVTCGKSGGVLICNGCQLTFCARHVAKHRQELAYQLEDIMQNHDLLRQEIGQTSNEHFHLQKIDKWERESIKRIRITAETARTDLTQILDRSKRRLSRIAREIALDLNSSHKTDNFLENDLIRWMKQLKELQLQMKSSYSMELIEDKRSPIYPIKITNNQTVKIRNHRNADNQSVSHTREGFYKSTNSISIENGGLLVKHIGSDLDYAHILGRQFYSQGRHTLRFQIEQCANPYIIFFGCISSEVIPQPINYNSPCVVGWFGYNEVYQHGTWNNNTTMYDYDSNAIETNDILRLTFDCDQKHIELVHERTNKTYKLSVNTDKAPFPWQLLVVLTHKDDCVRILPNK